MTLKLLFLLFCLMGVGVFSPMVQAEAPAQTVSFAVIVGSNRPGAGQAALHFAGNDAERFAAVLTELCGYPADNMTVLLDPDGKAVENALRQTALRIRQEQRNPHPG